MISITDQLEAMRSAMPPSKDKVMRHGLLGHEIDEIVFQAIAKHPGSLAAEITKRTSRRGIPAMSAIESLQRMTASSRVCGVRQKHTEKSRYWPSDMQAEALAWQNAEADRIKAFLSEKGAASTQEVAELLSTDTRSALRALRRVPGVECEVVKAGKWVWMWRVVK